MLKRNLPLAFTILVFIAGYLYCLSQYPGFASTRVIGDLLTDNAFLGIVAVGMTFVILSGGIDLSVGSTIAFTGVLLANYAWRLPGGGRLTLLALIMLLVVAVGVVLAHRTRFGHNVYAMGGNGYSAALMGVPVTSTTVRIYMLSSFLAVLSGIVFSLYTSAGYALAASGVELDAIAAVVIGGTLLTGGVGTLLGTLFGVMIQGLIQTYITFDGTLSSWWTKIVIGILLFGFIGLQKGLNAFWLARRGNGNVVAIRAAPLSGATPAGPARRGSS